MVHTKFELVWGKINECMGFIKILYENIKNQKKWQQAFSNDVLGE